MNKTKERVVRLNTEDLLCKKDDFHGYSRSKKLAIRAELKRLKSDLQSRAITIDAFIDNFTMFLKSIDSYIVYFSYTRYENFKANYGHILYKTVTDGVNSEVYFNYEVSPYDIKDTRTRFMSLYLRDIVKQEHVKIINRIREALLNLKLDYGKGVTWQTFSELENPKIARPDISKESAQELQKSIREELADKIIDYIRGEFNWRLLKVDYHNVGYDLYYDGMSITFNNLFDRFKPCIELHYNWANLR